MTTEADDVIPTRSDLAAQIEADLEYLDESGYQRFGAALTTAALGAVPWIGGVLSALASLKTEEGQRRATALLRGWLAAHEEQLVYLDRDVKYVIQRVEMLGPEAEARAQSPEYLTLVRRTFKAWDRADTDEKRRHFARLLANAAGSKLCPDDTVRLFIDWIDRLHESHLRMVRFAYKNPGCTKYDLGVELFGEPLPADNSAEADLFRELFRELNMMAIIRQPRATNEEGQFLRQSTKGRPRRPASATLESSFEDTKPQVLSELGKQFVHYVMDEIVPRIDR